MGVKAGFEDKLRPKLNTLVMFMVNYRLADRVLVTLHNIAGAHHLLVQQVVSSINPRQNN